MMKMARAEAAVLSCGRSKMEYGKQSGEWAWSVAPGILSSRRQSMHERKNAGLGRRYTHQAIGSPPKHRRVANDQPPGFDTLAIHAGAAPIPLTGARVTPIYQTTAHVFNDVKHAADLFALRYLSKIPPAS